MTQSGNPVIEKLAAVISDESYYYIGVNGSPSANDCTVYGLNQAEISALTKRYQHSRTDVINGIILKGPPFAIINSLAQLGYRVISSTGSAEIFWTLQRKI